MQLCGIGDGIRTASTKSSMVWLVAGYSHSIFGSRARAICKFLIPAITAALSSSVFRYGGSDTIIVKPLVMVKRPLEVDPRPRYWLITIDSISNQ